MNKFAPSHSIFRQQLERMKHHQLGFLEDLKMKEIMKYKAMKKKLKAVKVEAPETLNKFQEERERNKKVIEQVYEDKPDLRVNFSSKSNLC